jgi:hypothetical protein
VANALPHRPEQIKQAEDLAEEARFLGKKVFSVPTITIAPALVENLYELGDNGPIGEAASDIRALRKDSRFNQALTQDLAISQEIITDAMLDALAAGYVSEMDFQVTQITGLTYKLTDNDALDMHDYPIQGHTCAEISEFMHQSLRYEIEGLLASPLVGDFQISTLPDFIGAAMTRFGDKCANAIDEAYFAGIQMALRGVAKAIGVA